jgi:hypothetical protein
MPPSTTPQGSTALWIVVGGGRVLVARQFPQTSRLRQVRSWTARLRVVSDLITTDIPGA